MRVKVYLSDEGYGHIVRQRAIINQLKNVFPEIDITIQTKKYFEFAKSNIDANSYIEKFNNITWHKKDDGSPDLLAIENYYESYLKKSEDFIKNEEKDYDFVISDFVYEAFNHAENLNMPSFGVSHFTWDWFFSKLYPPSVSRKVLRYYFDQAEKANALFFPPFTPNEILEHYKANAISVPFIIREDINHNAWPCQKEKFKVLLMDSGAGLMKEPIKRALSEYKNQGDIVFGSPYELENDNCFQISADELLIDYVRGADLVIGRPGFNTISECIALRVPMLLISEAMNPEMEHNITELKKRRLGAFMSAEDFRLRFSDFLTEFLNHEYENLKRNMAAHDFATDGAKQIAEEILNRL